MDNRDRALEILKQARDQLLERICERIVASEDSLLEDAAGYTFAGEIEALYDQLGSKLHNVTTMLSTLQATATDSWTYLSSDGTSLHAVAMASVHAPFVQADTGEFGDARQLDATDRTPGRELLSRVAAREHAGEDMDKKAKKRIDVLNQKLQKLRLQLAGAKQQPDDPDDLIRIEREIEAAETELHKLKQS